jgi:tRNA(His) guanylyltransferase
MNDELGDRMKLYENAEAGRRFLPLIPILARIDGRTFSSFTRGLKRPYDETLSEIMVSTTAKLAKETNALLGYTQSDEISLLWYSDNIQSQIWFDGRIAKMTSQLAAQATLFFYTELLEKLPDYARKMPTFDARVWQVPNKQEAANCFLWRELDATKNSISMAAQSYYSHKQLQGKNGSEKQEMLFQKGVNWNNFPEFFKRGTYVRKRVVSRKFSRTELEKLPPKHAARSNPNLTVERTEWERIHFPPFNSVKNKEAVIFDGDSPILRDC